MLPTAVPTAVPTTVPCDVSPRPCRPSFRRRWRPPPRRASNGSLNNVHGSLNNVNGSLNSF
eukprot:1358820-Heterocapsa_arctica.AAC.1